MLQSLTLFEETSRRRERWYGGKLVPARDNGPWVTPDDTGMYPDNVFDLYPDQYGSL